MIIAFVPCRLKSTRLPKKATREIYGVPAIERCLLNTLAIPGVDKVVLATSIDQSDDELEKYDLDGKVEVTRGPVEDVIERFLPIIKKYNPDHVMRITGDNPFVSTELAEFIIKKHLEAGKDATFTTSPVALGISSEIYKAEAVLRLRELVPVTDYSEYLILYFLNNPSIFTLNNVKAPSDFIKPWRLTLDEKNDLELFKLMFKTLNIKRRPIKFEEVVSFFDQNPQAAKINTGNLVKHKDDLELITKIKDATTIEISN